MKYVQSATFRSLSSICIGALLYSFPNETTNWLVILVGILFLIPGLISIVAYFRLRSGSEAMRPLFPIIGIGSVFFGLILILFAGFFVLYIKYVLAAFLFMAGIMQIVSILRIKKLTHISLVFYLIPLLITLASIFIFFNVIKDVALISCYLGILMLIYGIMELLNAIVFRKERRTLSTLKSESISENAENEDKAKPDTEYQISESETADSTTKKETVASEIRVNE